MLSEYTELARTAWNNTSFSPERIGAQTIADYSKELEDDLKQLGENPGNYAEKYKAHFAKWLSAQSRCMSSFITGGSNFPVARARKQRNHEQSAYDNWRKWRDNYFKRAMAEPTKSPEQDLVEAIKAVDELTNVLEIMKAVNKIIRKYKTFEERNAAVLESELLAGSVSSSVLATNSFGYAGFASYELSSIRNKIKRNEQKIQTMKARIERKATFEPIQFEGGVIDIENDRVVIRHDEKPDRETLEALKKRGFRWSGKFSSWSRKHTAQAIIDARVLCGC